MTLKELRQLQTNHWVQYRMDGFGWREGYVEQVKGNHVKVRRRSDGWTLWCYYKQVRLLQPAKRKG
jgi:hypothetical protein